MAPSTESTVELPIQGASWANIDASNDHHIEVSIESSDDAGPPPEVVTSTQDSDVAPVTVNGVAFAPFVWLQESWLRGELCTVQYVVPHYSRCFMFFLASPGPLVANIKH